jgi:hypothetical protein
MAAPKNEIFFEVLPEASLKMGFGLRNSIISRAAFGILVSEEALRVASSDGFAEIPRGLLDIEETRFLRTREILDDVYMDLVKQAGEELYNRVHHTWQELTDSRMAWLRNLPEWEKIHRFKDYVFTLNDKDRLPFMRKTEEVIENLEQTLIGYVRGAIIHCRYESLSSTQVTHADSHRTLQHCSRPYLANSKTIYDSFSPQERTMTRFFWQILSKIPLSTLNPSNWVLFHKETYFLDNPYAGREEWICEQHGIKNIPPAALEKHVFTFDDAVEDATHDSGFTPTPSKSEDVEEISEKFSLADFFDQVRGHIQGVCDTMLDRGELDWATTTDTLLCLSEKEWSCLPDWEEREEVMEEPEKDEETKERCELTDISDWEGADDESMSEWDLLDE